MTNPIDNDAQPTTAHGIDLTQMTGASSEPATPTPSPVQMPATVPTQPVVSPTDSEKTPAASSDKTFSEKYVRELREEAKASRLELQKAIADAETKAAAAAQEAAANATKELTQNLGKALGLVKDDTPVDPAVIAQQAEARAAELQQQAADAETRVAAAEAAAREARVHADMVGRAVSLGADPEALMDSTAFTSRSDVKALDPNAADYRTQMDALIAAQMEANPRFRAARPVPGRSGADFAAGNAVPPAGPPSMDELIKRKTGGKFYGVRNMLGGQSQQASSSPADWGATQG